MSGNACASSWLADAPQSSSATRRSHSWSCRISRAIRKPDTSHSSRWSPRVRLAFAAPDTAVSSIAPEWTSSFRTFAIEPDGFVELHRVVPMPKITNYVGAIARIRVTADRAATRRLDPGFSDRVTAFLNGSPIFFRDDTYDFAQRRDGLISLNQARVFLPLRVGANDISIVVAIGSVAGESWADSRIQRGFASSRKESIGTESLRC